MSPSGQLYSLILGICEACCLLKLFQVQTVAILLSLFPVVSRQREPCHGTDVSPESVQAQAFPAWRFTSLQCEGSVDSEGLGKALLDRIKEVTVVWVTVSGRNAHTCVHMSACVCLPIHCESE